MNAQVGLLNGGPSESNSELVGSMRNTERMIRELQFSQLNLIQSRNTF